MHILQLEVHEREFLGLNRTVIACSLRRILSLISSDLCWRHSLQPAFRPQAQRSHVRFVPFPKCVSPHYIFMPVSTRVHFFSCESRCLIERPAMLLHQIRHEDFVRAACCPTTMTSRCLAARSMNRWRWACKLPLSWEHDPGVCPKRPTFILLVILVYLQRYSFRPFEYKSTQVLEI